MATTPARTYFATLRTAAISFGRSMGVDLTALPKPQRVALWAALAAVAVVCKALTDNNVLTAAQLQTALTAALAEVWPDEPIDPTPGP